MGKHHRHHRGKAHNQLKEIVITFPDLESQKPKQMSVAINDVISDCFGGSCWCKSITAIVGNPVLNASCLFQLRGYVVQDTSLQRSEMHPWQVIGPWQTRKFKFGRSVLRKNITYGGSDPITNLNADATIDIQLTYLGKAPTSQQQEPKAVAAGFYVILYFTFWNEPDMAFKLLQPNAADDDRVVTHGEESSFRSELPPILACTKDVSRLPNGDAKPLYKRNRRGHDHKHVENSDSDTEEEKPF